MPMSVREESTFSQDEDADQRVRSFPWEGDCLLVVVLRVRSFPWIGDDLLVVVLEVATVFFLDRHLAIDRRLYSR